MAKYIGRRVNIGVAPEAVRGVGVAPTKWVPKIDYTLFDKANKATSEESLSNISGYGNQEIVTQLHAEGEMGGEVNLKSFPLFLWGTFGTLATAAEGADYRHTLTIADSNQHKSLSIGVKEDNGDRLFENTMIDTMELTVTPEEIVKFSCGVKSKAPVDTSLTSAYETEDYKFVGRDLVFKVAAATGDLAAATAISTKEVTVTINKNTELDLVNGTLEPEDIHNKQITIEGSITLNYEDNTWRDYMLDGSYKAIGITLTQSRTPLDGAEDPEFYLELPRCAFSEWERETGKDDIQTQTINFKALYDQANSQLISNCYVDNDISSY